MMNSIITEEELRDIPGELKEYLPDTVRRYILASQIRIDVDYQRKLSEKRVDIIAKDFNKELMKAVTCNCRNGNYYCIDGEHRVMAIKKAAESSGVDPYVAVDLKINELTYCEEAAAFGLQDKNRKNITTMQKFNARVEAGEPEAKEILLIAIKNGLEIKDDDPRMGNTIIRSVGTLESVYKTYGPGGLDMVLYLIAEIFHKTPKARSSAFMKALVNVLSTYYGDIDINIAVKKWKSFSAEKVVYKAANNTSIEIAKVLVEIYNSRATKNRLNPEKLINKNL